jgi:hypothetical protein
VTVDKLKPRPDNRPFWRVASFCACVIVVVLFILVSSKAGMRGIGVVMLAGACAHLIKRSIPYGWEGQEPSGYITGIPAVLLGLLMVVAGLVMLVLPEFILVLLGWG